MKVCNNIVNKIRSSNWFKQEGTVRYFATQQSERYNSYTPIRCIQKLEQFLLIFSGEEQTMEKTAKANGETRLTSVLGVFGEWPESVPWRKGFSFKRQNVLETDSEAILFLDQK